MNDEAATVHGSILSLRINPWIHLPFLIAYAKLTSDSKFSKAAFLTHLHVNRNLNFKLA